MVSNANVVVILVLGLSVSNGSLLPSTPSRPGRGLEGFRFEDHPYRQSRLPKRPAPIEFEPDDKLLLYGKREDADVGSGTFAAPKRHPWLEHAGGRPPWRKRSYRDYALFQIFLNRPAPFLTKSPEPKHKHKHRLQKLHRKFDVPQIACPPGKDGTQQFSCPSTDRTGRFRCLEEHDFCDGFIDCPNAEDEERHACFFYKTTKFHLDVVSNAVLKWARGAHHH